MCEAFVIFEMWMMFRSTEWPGVVEGPDSWDGPGDLTDLLDAEGAQAHPVQMDEIPVALKDVVGQTRGKGARASVGGVDRFLKPEGDGFRCCVEALVSGSEVGDVCVCEALGNGGGGDEVGLDSRLGTSRFEDAFGCYCRTPARETVGDVKDAH